MESALKWIDILDKLWPVFVALLGQFAWIIRLEAKVLYLEKDQANHKEINDKLWNKLNELHATQNSTLLAVARLEVKLGESKK